MNQCALGLGVSLLTISTVLAAPAAAPLPGGTARQANSGAPAGAPAAHTLARAGDRKYTSATLPGVSLEGPAPDAATLARLVGIYDLTNVAAAAVFERDGRLIVQQLWDRKEFTLLDTGDFYGMGHNELLLREALAGRPRDMAHLDSERRSS